MTLLTPSAAITIGARSSRPSRVRSVTPSASCRACAMAAGASSSAPASTRQRRQQVIELDAPDQQDRRGRASASGTRRPDGPSRYRLETGCVGIRRSASGSQGNRDSTRVLIPPPHGFCRGSAIALDDEHAHAGARQAQRGGRARGARARDDDVGS